MSIKTRSVTIQDVAQTAGVSVSTVSRVLNNKVDVSEDTQDRIRDVIYKLGYSSNLAARSMRSTKKNMIGLIVPDVEHPYALEVLKGVNHIIATTRFDLLIYTTGSFQKQDTALREQQYVSLLNGVITDGTIVVTPSANSFVTNAPIVSIDPHVLTEEYPSILVDHYDGALQAVRYLVQLHHRRIAYISGRAGMQNSERYRAYYDGMAEAGISIDPALVVEGDYSTSRGVECARELLGLSLPPTAIFAANDQTALGVFDAACELGIRIPEDLSVVGFDNIPEAQTHGLTTVDQPLEKMGSAAVDLLINLIEGEKAISSPQKWAANLVIRSSCQVLSP